MVDKEIKCPNCGDTMQINTHFNSFPNYVCSRYGWKNHPVKECYTIIKVSEYKRGDS